MTASQMGQANRCRRGSKTGRRSACSIRQGVDPNLLAQERSIERSFSAEALELRKLKTPFGLYLAPNPPGAHVAESFLHLVERIAIEKRCARF